MLWFFLQEQKVNLCVSRYQISIFILQLQQIFIESVPCFLAGYLQAIFFLDFPLLNFPLAIAVP